MHMICIVVLVLCFWRKDALQRETIAANAEATGTETLVLTVTPAPTQPPVLTTAPTPVLTPMLTATPTPAPTPILTATPTPTAMPTPMTTQPPIATVTPAELSVLDRYEIKKEELLQKSEEGYYQALDNTQHDWWFARKKNHTPSESGAEIKMDNLLAFYRNEHVAEGDKVIYLTFDCGYEIGCTATILDTLARHEAKALFFVTKAFIQKNPELVRRMKEEGHLVGNHTMNHPIMPTKSDQVLMDEILGCAELFYRTTGYEMDPFLRPPTGAYSERTLRLTEDLGYATVFWSIAYKDYDTENQPGKDYVVDHFTTYHHNGAIPLIHNTSTSNTEALEEVLTMLEEEGYRFGSLYELVL